MRFIKDKGETAAALRGYLDRKYECSFERCYSLGGIKTVKLTTYDSMAIRMLDRQLSWSRIDPVDNPDARVFLFQEESLTDFHNRVLGIKDVHDGTFIEIGEVMLIPEGEMFKSYMDIDVDYGTLLMRDKDTFWHAVKSFEPHVWGKDGHLLVKMFYQILNTPDSCLVHSACVGLENNGLMFCARAMRGKSTLTITAMLKGFEYVSDDYMILERRNGKLVASPVYNITNLSPRMYDILYDDLAKARYVCPSATQNKYTLDISAYEDRLRRRYPVRAAMIPVIDPSATEPRVEPCDAKEKGSGITQLIHSTVTQIWDKTPSETIAKLSSMLRPLPFYKIILSPDIFTNVKCLRQFIIGTFSN